MIDIVSLQKYLQLIKPFSRLPAYEKKKIKRHEKNRREHSANIVPSANWRHEYLKPTAAAGTQILSEFFHY